MRKKFAEDDLLGRFRLKNNHALRIDFKPTPPEQVEEVKKEMEPLIENLESSEKSQSNLSIDWDSNEIEVPDNMPSDEELKAILFHEPKDDVPSEQNDIFKSQRHQKMLELLAKVESLTQAAEAEETRHEETRHEEARYNESLSQPLMEPASKELKDAVKESSLFNGEEAEMRSGNEQLQSVQSNQTAAQPKGSGTETKETPKMEPPLKLDVDHEDFQERLIRILNENYSEMGEIRPQNLKSRLIEILNEEYAEEYYDDSETAANSEFEPDTETEASEETEDELEADDTFETEAEAEVETETEVETEDVVESDGAVESEGAVETEAVAEAETETEAEVETDVETESGLEFESDMDDEIVVSLEDDPDAEQKSDGVQKPEFAVPNLKDESGFLSEDYNHNSHEAGLGGAFAATNSELPQTDDSAVKRNRERFSHFQYVTSFKEVVESEDEDKDKEEAVSESGEEAISTESENHSTPLNAPEEDLQDQADEDFEAEPVPDADPSAAGTEAGSGIQDAEPKKDEHPWLKELRADGRSEDSPAEASDTQTAPEPSYSQPAPEPHWTFAGQDEISAAEQAGDQEEERERGWDRDHRQKQRTASQEERLFGAEREAAPKGEKPVPETQVAQNGERYMSVDEWSFVFDTLKEQIDYLRKQLEIKDHQLQNKDELIRNFQILLKNEQDKFLKLENKMEDVVLQVEERAAKKGFFSRFRKR